MDTDLKPDIKQLLVDKLAKLASMGCYNMAAGCGTDVISIGVGPSRALVERISSHLRSAVCLGGVWWVPISEEQASVIYNAIEAHRKSESAEVLANRIINLYP